jgi:hypothetical protein
VTTDRAHARPDGSRRAVACRFLPLVMLASACGRDASDWLADLDGQDPLVRRLAAAALADAAPDERVVNGLFAAASFRDAELDALLLQALQRQPGAAGAAIEHCRTNGDRTDATLQLAEQLLLSGVTLPDAVIAALLDPQSARRETLLRAVIAAMRRGWTPPDSDTRGRPLLGFLRWLTDEQVEAGPTASALPLPGEDPALAAALGRALALDTEASKRLDAGLRTLDASSRDPWLQLLTAGHFDVIAAGDAPEGAAVPFLAAWGPALVPHLVPHLHGDPRRALPACRALHVLGAPAAVAIPALRELARRTPFGTLRAEARSAADALAAAAGR